MTIIVEKVVWFDPADGYKICVRGFPQNVGDVTPFSFHIGELWIEGLEPSKPDKLPTIVQIDQKANTHVDFPSSLLVLGYSDETHYLLEHLDGGLPLRNGSRTDIETLLGSIKADWKAHRQAASSEFQHSDSPHHDGDLESEDQKQSTISKMWSRKGLNKDEDGSSPKATRLKVLIIDPLQSATKKTTQSATIAAEVISTGAKGALDSTAALATALLATTQGVLASSLSVDLNSMLHGIVNSPATIYDKAMDAVYLQTHIGGGSHRMFDGGHTLYGAFKAVRDASPDDTIIQEAMGFLEGLFKDMTTPKGLPLVNWDKATYDQVATYLASNFGISKSWFEDILTYNAAELLASVIGVIAVALAWNRSSTEEFANIVSGMALPAVLRANPLLLIVTIVALAKAFHKAHVTGEYTELIDGGIKGGVTTGISMVAVANVSILGGPAGLALLAGIAAGLLAAKATEKVSVTEIGVFVARRVKIVANETKKMCKTQRFKTQRALSVANS